MAGSGDRGRSALARFAPLAIVVLGLALGYALGLHHYLSLATLAEKREALTALVEENTALTAALYAAAYALAVAFAFPAASVLTIFGGFLFGWLGGAALTALAATIGATALFLAARSAFADILRQKAGPRVLKLRDGFARDAFSYLLVLRLAPVFPFFVVNIAPALFDVPLKTFVAATMLGILPGTFAYSYLGDGIDAALVSAAESGQELTLGDLVTPQLTIAFAILALIATVPIILRKLRGAA